MGKSVFAFALLPIGVIVGVYVGAAQLQRQAATATDPKTKRDQQTGAYVLYGLGTFLSLILVREHRGDGVVAPDEQATPNWERETKRDHAASRWLPRGGNSPARYSRRTKRQCI